MKYCPECQLEKPESEFSKKRAAKYIDAHKIVAIDKNKGYLIANNHGFENGWTKRIFGKAVMAEFAGRVKE